MVDVSQDVIIRELDCGTTDGLEVSEIHEGKEKIESFRERLIGRYAVGDVTDPATGKVIVPEGKMMDLYDAEKIEAAGITHLKIRSLLTCRAKTGVCARCYGSNMATGEPVQLGESVGIIAAQSIGEPGTQLTMRTFHTGGIASAEDITQGLPRVEELFESRRPKSMAIMSEISGVVSQDDTKKNVVIKVTGKDDAGAEVVKSYSIPFTQHARVMPGDRVEKGDIITREGVLYPQDILAVKGLDAVQNYLISEVQKVYRLQGVEIKRQAHRGHHPPDVPQGPGDRRRLLRPDRRRAGQPAGCGGRQPGAGRPHRGRGGGVRLVEYSRCCWASPRPPWPPRASCRRHPSRRPPAC